MAVEWCDYLLSHISLTHDRYQEMVGDGPEYLMSASEDNTLYLWNPAQDKKPITRATGHQRPVNHVAASPCGRMFASASFDKSCKLWDSKTGR